VKIIVLVIAAFFLIWGAFLFHGRVVRVETPKRGPVVQGVYGTGIVETEREVPLSFERAGRLKSLWVREGQGVKGGELLAALDLDDEKANTESLKSAEENALQIYNRKQTLFHKKIIPIEQLQGAKTTYEQAHYDRVRSEATIEKGEIRAPENGIIIRKDKEVGETLQSDEVFLWFSPEKIRITAEVDEEYFPLLNEGQMAYCQAPSFPKQVFKARIYEITRKGDTAKRTYRIRLQPMAPYPSLNLGMTIEVNVVVREDSRALLVPHRAYEQGFVWIVKNNHLEKRQVSVGVQNDTSIEVRQGLYEDEQIVLSPNDSMKEGQWVWAITP
jgi:RND family efflux transporter MFP subunit